MSFFAYRFTLSFGTIKNFGKFAAETSNLQIRNYAARKGYRQKRERNKVKKVVEKVGFIPFHLRNRDKVFATRGSLKYDDYFKMDPIDDVYNMNYYKWKVYPFLEAVQCHKETHHPEIYNKPNESLHVRVELNMQGDKPTRFVDNFTRIVSIPNRFDHGEERNILVFSKDSKDLDAAREAGAQLTGGLELIKLIQDGDISLQDFHFFLAHPNILPELVQLRGLMKRKFPNPKQGSLGVDMGAMVHKFFNGISYTCKKDEFEKDFGLIETVIGTLDMDSEHLEENFACLIRDIHQMKPKRPGDFVRRCVLWSPPSPEKLKTDYKVYLEPTSEELHEDKEDESVENVAL